MPTEGPAEWSNGSAGVKALLIEDNPGDVRLIHELLSDTVTGSIAVESAPSLSEGVERLRRGGINVALLDLSLPDSNGFNTIERLHEEAPHVPIIALSSFDDAELVHRAVQKGADDYLIKGAFTADLLARSIHYAIDRSKAREQLAQARDSALESARMRAEFLANMSHEIRTPLNGIVGMIHLLTETTLDGDQREMLNIALSSAQILMRTVNDILDFSKLSAGKVALEETDFDLASAVESVIALFTEQSQRKAIELASYIDNDVPTLLRGDPARLCQVLTNLVGNAVKFTTAGEVSLRVGIISDGGEATLRFTVKDTGIGIPLDGQRHLFQAFTQATRSTARKFGGTGLGLAISAQLVELMGGSIGVQSEPGSGSTFWFTASFRRQPSVPAAGFSDRLAGAHILVADRSEAAARIVCDHVRSWGIRCDTALTAVDAIVAIKNAASAGDPYGVVIVEMQLPDMDGLTLARTIKADPRFARSRIIGTYVLGGRPDESQLRAAGIRALLAKPIKQSQLYNSLNTVLAVASSVERVATSNEPKAAAKLVSRLSESDRAATSILLVEDNFVNQEVQKRLLKRFGYKVDVVTDGKQAVDALANRTYDIVLMDCQMPVLDGYSATRQIRRNEGSDRHTIIIGVTAHALAGDREECLAAGMDDYLSKPVMPDELAATIDKWVGLRMSNPGSQGSSAAGAQDDPAVDGIVLDEKTLEKLGGYAGKDEPNFLAELLRGFLDDLSTRMASIKTGLQNRDLKAMREAAHALKASCAELGARRMEAACQRIELCPDESLLRDGKTMLASLEREEAHLRSSLTSESRKHGLPG